MNIQKSEYKREYYLRRNFLILMIACITMGVACYHYYQQIQETFHIENTHYLTELSNRITSNIDKNVNDNFAVLDTLRTVLEDSNAQSFTAIYPLIDKQKSYWNYENVYLVDEAGVAYDMNGDMVSITGDSLLRQLSKDSRTMIPAQIINNKEYVLFTIPLTNMFIDDKHMVALMSSYTPKAFEQILSMTSFNERAYSSIVDQDGKVLIRSTSQYAQKFGYNMLQSILETDKRASKTIEQLHESLKNQEQGQVSFSLGSDEEILVYSPMNHEKWYLFMFVPVSVVNERSQLLLNSTLLISCFLIVLFASLLIILINSFTRNKRRLERIAYVDPITKGNTIQRFNERVNTLLKNEKYEYVMIFSNIQKFKLLNDQLGRQECDQLLCYINDVFFDTLQAHESYGHYSADNFCLLLENASQEVILLRLHACYYAILALCEKNNMQLPQLVLEFGVFGIHDSKMKLQDMIDRSAFALQSSQYLKQYKDTFLYAFYNDETRHQMLFEKHLEDMMEQSLKENEFQVFLQPKYALIDHCIGGAEALVRWFSKQDGMIFPDQFIPLFEKNGFVIKLDLWVFEQVCKLLQSWQEEGKKLIKISINCSRAHLWDDNFLDAYEKIFNRYHFPAEFLELELTENMMFEDNKQLVKVIDHIHALGFSCSMDDFGSGYSSLNLIQDIYVDTIKLDKVFFKEHFVDDQRMKAVIDCVLKMARSLSMKTVAEGIEDWDQVEVLQGLGCDYIQGYVFAKPMPISEFERMLFQQQEEQ